MLACFIEPVMTVGLSKDDVIETNDDDAIIIDTYTKSIAMNDEESAFMTLCRAVLQNYKLVQTNVCVY